MAQNSADSGYAPLPLSRSLTVVSTENESPAARPSGRTEIGFLAHLLSIRLDAPQYRTKRREQPVSAIKAYAMTQRSVPIHLASRAA
jgi:hypothetical protein